MIGSSTYIEEEIDSGQQAKQVEKDLIEEASRFSNPNVPWQAKLAAGAIILFLLIKYSD